MSESVFSRVFAYRQREKKSPTENFLTEIFAFCLDYDKEFRKDFFKQFLDLEVPDEAFVVSTQSSYSGYGIPDIEINYPGYCMLVECKVEAPEGENQLKIYLAILEEVKRQTKKHLVYITKYFDQKSILETQIRFNHIRWSDIHDIIAETHSEITKQFKRFLKDNDMEAVKNFKIEDLIALNTISDTIKKMDDILEHFRPVFENQLGGFSKVTHLRNYYHGYCIFKHKGLEYQFCVGFYWGSEGYEIPNFGLWFSIHKSKFEKTGLRTILSTELKESRNWKYNENDNEYYLMRPVTDFLGQKEDSIPLMKAFVESILRDIYQLREKHPDYFVKYKD